MSRIDPELVKEITPQRMKYAIDKIKAKGYEITDQDDTKIQFQFKGNQITMYPYSGWHTGKGIVDGRGINELIKQI